MINDIWRVTITSSIQGQKCQNVLFYKDTGGASESDSATRLMAFMESDVIFNFCNAQVTTLTWGKITAARIYPLPVSRTYELDSANSGQMVEVPMPSEVSAVLQKKTVFGGRKFRGRVYLAGTPALELSATTGKWNGVYQLLLSAAANVLPIRVPPLGTTAAFTPVIYHKADHTTTDIDFSSYNDVPRAQRRRQAGRGI